MVRNNVGDGLGLFLVFIQILPSSFAHVVLVDPVPRSNNDYLYTTEPGVCRGESCNAFCGDPFDAETNPITELPVGTPVQVRWKTTVIHEPFEYRISLSTGGDETFDFNPIAVVSNKDAHDDRAVTSPRTGSFTANITIPESYLTACGAANEGSSLCTLQLYDLYYFVSCANILLSTAAAVGTTADPPNEEAGDGSISAAWCTVSSLTMQAVVVLLCSMFAFGSTAIV